MVEPDHAVAESLASRLEFETVLSDLSSRFVNLPSRELDSMIVEAERMVCQCLGIDLAAVWQWSAGSADDLTMTHLYRPLGGPPVPESMQAAEYFPWVLAELQAGRTIRFTRLDELPPAAARDRAVYEHFGIKSSLNFPLAAGGGPTHGCLGFNMTRTEREWPEPIVQRLRLVAEVFANALVRKCAYDALRDSEERLTLAADAAGAGLWTLDFRTGVFWSTDRGRTIFGYPPDLVITLERFEASVLPEDRCRVRSSIERTAQTGQPLDVEYRIRRGEGSTRWIVSRGRSRRAPTGEPESLMGVSIDITARRLVDEALRSSEARLAAAADLAGLGYFEEAVDDGTLWTDDRLREILGLSSGRDHGLEPLSFWLEHVHPDDVEAMVDRRRALHEGTLPRFDLEFRYLHPTRGQRWIAHFARIAARRPDGRASSTVGVLRDVTDARHAEETLHHLSQRLIRAHEDERALIARELHDDLTQRLAVLAIEAGRAELAASSGSQAAILASIREGLARLSDDVHALAYHLHPSVLQELGLPDALRVECDRRSRCSSFEIHVDLDPDAFGLDREAALCLFRVAQEALTNVSRHAHAEMVTVTLRRVEDGVVLAVRDDGIGFTPADSGSRRSLGLASMRERLQLARGRLTVESAPGAGTSVVAWVPDGGGAR